MIYGALVAMTQGFGPANTRLMSAALRDTRDATLGAPNLLWPSIQTNVRAGHLPPPELGDRRFMKIPIEDRS